MLVKHGHRGGDGDESLPDAFWSVAHRLRKASKALVGQWSVTPAQSRALGVLSRHGTMRLSVLSEYLHIAPRSTTEVADDLEAKGLVHRHPDPNDRRATLIELTAEGVVTSKAIEAARAADAEQLFDRLTEREKADLTRILKKLRD